MIVRAPYEKVLGRVENFTYNKEQCTLHTKEELRELITLLTAHESQQIEQREKHYHPYYSSLFSHNSNSHLRINTSMDVIGQISVYFNE